MMDHMVLQPPGYPYSYPPPATSPDPPIDPSLAIDPAILGESSNNEQAAPSPRSSRPSSPASPPQFQFEQGPQGDPFAPPPPQPPQSYFARLPSPPRPLKRKRKSRPVARRDDECSFCQGDDARNKGGLAEQMVSCVACGRSGHPSCLGIAGIADVLRSYPWHCIECKICEVCEKKGNGNRMLFCDACDRGWHMDCLRPPLEDTPDGSWVCPLCPPIALSPPDGVGPPFPDLLPPSVSPAPSVASSSHVAPQSEPYYRLRTAGKHSRKAQDPSESDEDEPPRVRHKANSEVRIVHKGRGMSKGRIKLRMDVKGKGRARAPEETHVSLRIPKFRMTMRGRSKEGVSSSPDSPIRPTRKVRLVVKRPKVMDEEDEEDEEDSPSHMFDGILTQAQCSTANTAIHDSDRTLFTRSRTRAESKLGPPVAPIFPSALFTNSGHATPTASTPTPGPSSGTGHLHSLRTRHSIAQALHFQAALDTPPGTPLSGAASTHLPGTSLPPRIRTIRFGDHDVDTWYDAPFPEEYASVSDGKLWMCEFCLKYMKSKFQSTRHRMKCKARHPPGDEIYRDGSISVFEVDGRKNKIYCQNLCLLSKMFLDHKSLFYDVEPFLFYVMTEVDRLGARFVGYFSKEKRSPKDYNVSCIMTLPVRQRRGWGNILIDFSYLLSKKENRVGSPERPLSALGALAYKQYWTHAVKMFLHTASEPVTLEDISRGTAMTLEDIYNTLREQNMITAKEVTPPPPPRPPPGTPIKYLRGRKNGPGITRRGLARTSSKDDAKAQLVIPTEYTVHWDPEALDAYVSAWRAKEHATINPRCLKWSPFLLSRERRTQTADAAEKTTQAAAGEISGGAAVPELDRSSASSTQVPQGAPMDIAVSTPKHAGESALLDLAIAAEMQSPSLTVDVEDSKPRVPSSLSRDTSQVAENQDNSADRAQTAAPARILRIPARSLREVPADRARSSSLASESLSQRVLRPRGPANNNKRKHSPEDEETPDGTAEDERILQDSALAAKLAQEDLVLSRRTRSSYRTDPPKPATTRAPPRKRQRVESSTESEPESGTDPDGSLSELTRTSRSSSPSPPSPPPPRRRVTRALNGKLPNGTRENGTTNGASRAVRSDTQPLASSVRSSSRINGATHPSLVSTLKRPVIISQVQVARTRSTRRTKANSTPDDQDMRSKGPAAFYPQHKAGEYQREEEEEAEGEAETKAPPEENSASRRLTAATNFVNGTSPDMGQGGTPAMYDEDALGEEDAEGEEDPNPDSEIE